MVDIYAFIEIEYILIVIVVGFGILKEAETDLSCWSLTLVFGACCWAAAVGFLCTSK
jgi:hypothetical protein